MKAGFLLPQVGGVPHLPGVPHLHVNRPLEAHEDFLGFYNVPDIGAETIVSAIKDVLLKLQLSLVNCRGQCYDEASNMIGHKTGVAKRILDFQQKKISWGK